MKQPSFLYFMIVVLVACNSHTNVTQFTYYVKYQQIKNLHKGDPVNCKGKPIGSISDLSLQPDYEVLVEVKLDIPLHMNDTIALVNSDSFGGQAIEVIKSNPPGKTFKSHETIPGVVIDKPAIPLDSATLKIVADSLIYPYIQDLKRTKK